MSGGRFLRHPVHRVLVIFPLGLLATSFFFDLGWLLTGHERLSEVSYALILGGVAGAVLASLFGVLEWMEIPRGTRAWRMAALHGGGNSVVAALFALGWTLRSDAPWHPSVFEIALSGAGVLLIVATAWLGGEVARRTAQGAQ